MRFAIGNRVTPPSAVAPVALAALLAVGLLAPLPLLAEGDEEEVPTKLIKMQVENFRWEPDKIAVPEGTHVTLRITGYDATHRFDLKKPYNLKVLIPQGETVDVEFVAKHVGTFKWRCGRPCGNGCPKMTGKLIVYDRTEAEDAEGD